MLLLVSWYLQEPIQPLLYHRHSGRIDQTSLINVLMGSIPWLTAILKATSLSVRDSNHQPIIGHWNACNGHLNYIDACHWEMPLVNLVVTERERQSENVLCEFAARINYVSYRTRTSSSWNRCLKRTCHCGCDGLPSAIHHVFAFKGNLSCVKFPNKVPAWLAIPQSAEVLTDSYSAVHMPHKARDEAEISTDEPVWFCMLGGWPSYHANCDLLMSETGPMTDRRIKIGFDWLVRYFIHVTGCQSLDSNIRFIRSK